MKKMRDGIFFAITAIVILLYALSAGAETPSADEWRTLKTGYFTIEYESSVDLNTVAGRLNSRGLFSSGFFSLPSPLPSTPEEEVAWRVDRLLKHVEEMLGMYPSNFKLAIKIFKSDVSLAEAYFRMMGSRQNYQAFYIYQYRTIYTSEYGVSDSVMSHEMAHAVIDSYFSANPPPKVAEILATYVDAHLEE